jgi:hypothetical protein
MSDDFEDTLKRWLRDRGVTDRSDLHALAGHVAMLPPRRRRETGLAAVAAVIVAIGLAAFALAPRSGTVSALRGDPVPPDAVAFAGDPRLARCGATPESALAVFEMTHARDYRLHLPAMGLSPELDVDSPAFVVVYRAMQPFGMAGAPAPDGRSATPPRSTVTPGRRDVCVLVGADGATSEQNIYADVDVTGLTVAVVSVDLTDHFLPSPTAIAPAPSVTPEPAPAWVADLAGQLDCDGPVASIGGEVPDVGSLEPFGSDPETALEVFLGPSNFYASLPTAGFTKLHEELHWASFGHVFAGRTKAIVVLSDTTEFGPGWTVVGVRACDASEFDPAVPLTFPVTIWTDASGKRVSTETIRSNPGPGHCGWDSAVFLNVNGDLFFRDPKRVMADWTKTRFDSTAQLPANATDSGFRSGKWSLWLDPGRDAYLVSAGGIERWPRSTDPFLGCA